MMDGTTLALFVSLGNLLVGSTSLYFILKMIFNDLRHLSDRLDRHLEDHSRDRGDS